MNSPEGLINDQKRVPIIICGALCFLGFFFLYMVISQPIPEHNIGGTKWYYTSVLAIFLVGFNLYKYLNINYSEISMNIIKEIDINAKLTNIRHQEGFVRMDNKAKEQYLFVSVLGQQLLRRMVFNESIFVLGLLSVKLGMPKNYYYIFLITGLSLLIYMNPKYEKVVSIYKNNS